MVLRYVCCWSLIRRSVPLVTTLAVAAVFELLSLVMVLWLLIMMLTMFVVVIVFVAVCLDVMKGLEEWEPVKDPMLVWLMEMKTMTSECL
jgi:hypothetical protein